MKTGILVGLVGAGLLAAPLGAAEKRYRGSSHDSDMRRAIAFERHKDVAAARQARKEARHPEVSYSNAERNAEGPDRTDSGRRSVQDSGPAAWQRHQQERKKK